MKFHYAGEYSGDPNDLPSRSPEPGAVPFKEMQGTKSLGLLANGLGIVLLALTFGLLYLRCGSIYMGLSAFIAAILSLVPHEFLHALCYREDVYMYQNIRHGMLFVIGTESFSKGRFILKSMLPSIVLAFIPFLACMINPSLGWLGTFVAIGIASAAGDYYNVYLALTQMPKGALAYLSQDKTFWYLPSEG